MGLLRGSKIYTIGNLQYSSFEHAKEWREYLKNKLNPRGIKILSPLDKMFSNFPKEDERLQEKLKIALNEGDFNFVHEEAKIIRARDLSACDHSTCLIAYLDITKPTIGSIDEIITSKRNCKPVFLVIDGGYKNCPIWLCSYFKPSWVYDSLDKVIETLYDIDDGKIEVNNKYWKILEDEYI